MNIKDLKNKLIAVLGFGQEGQAVTKYLLKHGMQPVLFDQKPWGDWTKKEQKQIKSLKVNFIFGPDAFKELAGFDVAFRSPGIPLSHPDLLQWTELIITSQTKFFFDNCPSKIIGVTGTKGKGTTASLISRILKMKFEIRNSKFETNSKSKTLNPKPQVYLTGNIGGEQPLDFLDELKKQDWVVYELSSFQLQDLNKSPHIAVVLMITSEHLDYHKNQSAYQLAKSTITQFQTPKDFTIFNIDYLASKNIGLKGKAVKLPVSTKQRLDRGVFVEKNEIVVKLTTKPYLRLKTSDFQLPGRHNLENICAATAVAACLRIKPAIIQKAVENFKGLPHRLEFVAKKAGIKFYNDSFSTTPETAVAGIQSFNEPLIAILGGSSKNSDFTRLGKTIASSKNIKAIILIGHEAGRIKSAIGKSKIKTLTGAKNMLEIFKQIRNIAQPGYVVLLSPACASFGMFKNYKDRGEQFKRMVSKL